MNNFKMIARQWETIALIQALICLFFVSSSFAGIAEAQDIRDQKVSLKAEHKHLKSVMKLIEETTSTSFMYNPKHVDVGKKISVHFQEKTLEYILHYLFDPMKIDFKIVLNRIILNPAPETNSNHFGQQILPENPISAFGITSIPELLVKGSIHDSLTNEPLPGVSVLVEGTKSGTISDGNGNFEINVSDADARLRFSFIGYLSKTITVGNRTEIKILLTTNAQNLNEVVVIGYGKQSQAKVIGSIGQIDAAALDKIAAASVDQQLAGKMSGVIINQSNGQPGAASQIVIRGTGTLTAGSNPLIVVDGFPLTEGTSLNAVNPNDIENITILKDAASASIYGSRAANGVVLVTTKQGSNNGKSSISFDMYTGVQQQSSGVELVDGYQFARFLKEARNWGYVSKDLNNRSESDLNTVRVTKKINGKNIDGRELNLDYLQPYLDGTPNLTNTNWMKEAFRKASISNYTLSFSGGNDKTKYYTSLGYFDQDGIVLGTNMKRYSASISLESKLNNKIKIGLNVKPSFTGQHSFDQSSRSSGILSLIPLSFPFYTPLKNDGSLNISDQLANEQRVIEGVRINGTPVESLRATALKVIDNNQRFKTFGNFYVGAELINNLTYRLSIGGDYDSYSKDYYYPSDVGQYRVPAPRADANGAQNKVNTTNYLIENTLDYKCGFKNHTFEFLAGHVFQKQKSDLTSITGTGFPDNNIKSVAGASSFSVDNSLNIWTLESYIARVQYDFDAKYLISAATRRDGSSRFGTNNRWGSFPSLSVGWVLSRENFFPDNKFINFAKISASWGQTGNNQIGAYGSQALVTNSNYVFGNKIAPGYITNSAPNPDLGWEVASSLNLGADLGILNNKLNAGLAYYKTNTRNLLLNVPVPQQTGYNIILANIGEMENQGFEFQLNGKGFKIGRLDVSFNTNLTSYKNKVLALGPGQNQIATGGDENFITKIGSPIAEIYGYNVMGIYKTAEEINNSPHLNGTLTGDYIVQDVNNDGKITVADRVPKGNYAPDLTYGFGSDFGYKGFNFGFNFIGVEGRTLLDGDMSALTEAGEGFAVPSIYYFENRYHPVNNPNGFLGQPNFGNFSNSRKLLRSSVVVQKNNGDYIRLRDIRLAYNFQTTMLKNLKLSALQVYVSGNNVFTKTKFRGWNPDGTSDNILTSGFTSGANYPVAKSFLFGLRVTY